MASFKICISDPKTGKTYQKEVKDSEAQPFIGLNIDGNVKGELVGLTGYELQITGGSDYCGFPMRHGILGVRKKINIYGGVGFKGKKKVRKMIKRVKGMRARKTVCGHKITDSISQINLKVIKAGSKKLGEALGVAEKEGAKGEKKETPKEEKKEAPKGEKKEAPKEEEKPKEEVKTPKEKKEEKPKEEAKKEEPKK